MAWLERLQEDRLVASVHKMIAETEREMARSDEGTMVSTPIFFHLYDSSQVQRLAELTQYCITYGIPLPEPST